MSSNHNKTNLKARDRAHNRTQTNKRELFVSFLIFMAWVAAIGFLLSLVACQRAQAQVNTKSFTTDNNSGYYIDLLNSTSGQATRDILAFFVPDNSPASQAVTIQSSTAPKARLSATREHSLISIANHLLTDYDGLTLQNKIAERRICRAVSCRTESKTRHPISLLYSVAFTQNLQGAIHHG